MSTIEVEEYSNAVLLRLANGVTNPVNLALVKELTDLIADLKEQSNSDQYKGLVLSGGEKFFSIGLDIPGMINASQEMFSEFWDAFNHLLFEIYTLPLPTVCAMQGNSIAGGAVIALCCDYRYAADNGKKIGLNEIKLGVPIPYLTSLILPNLASDYAVREIIYEGNFISFDTASKLGLVDNIYSANEVESKALEKASGIAQLPREAFQVLKATHVEAVAAAYLKHHREKNRIFVDMMFSEPARSRMKMAVKNF